MVEYKGYKIICNTVEEDDHYYTRHTLITPEGERVHAHITGYGFPNIPLVKLYIDAGLPGRNVIVNNGTTFSSTHSEQSLRKLIAERELTQV